MNSLTNYKDHIVIQGQSFNTSGLFSREVDAYVDLTFPVTYGNSAPGQINTWYDGFRSLAGSPLVFTLGGSPTGGTFLLSVTTVGTPRNPGQTLTTGTIAYNASAATVQTALRALANVGTALSVTGSAGGPWTITPTAAMGAWSLAADLTAVTGGTPTQTITNSQIANPTTAATFSAASTTGGTLVQSTTIYVKYSYINASGETLVNSIEATYAVPASGTSTNTILATAPALPSGATGINVYVGSAAGAEAFVGTSAGNTYTITGLPAAGAAVPSNWNTTFAVSETLNLTDGSLADPFGVAISYKGISSVHVQNPSTVAPMALYGGGTFAGMESSPNNKRWIGNGIVGANGIVANGYCQNPAYGVAGGMKVFSGINNTLKITSYDPAGITYGIFIPGCV